MRNDKVDKLKLNNDEVKSLRKTKKKYSEEESESNMY